MALTDDAHDRMMDSAAAGDNEQVLLHRLAQGDQPVFWAIWAPYRQELLPHCRRWMGGHREEAEDALSNAGLKAWHHLPTYAQECVNVKGWLMRLLHNHCIDMVRTLKRQDQVIQKMTTRSHAQPACQPLIGESPEEVASRHEVLQGVRQALASLPPSLQDTAELRLVCDLSYREIADQLHISPENARKRMQQARAILQTSLAQYRSGKMPDVSSVSTAASG